jgi:hypothetical protein
MSNPIVLIPVHKHVPSNLEIISLRQCGRCLARKALALLAPAGLDLRSYQEIFPSARVIRVETKWMNTVLSYNRMMINPMIYNILSHHSHILVHEPDAMVLRDELDFWCEQPYDYIGAPWFEGYDNAKPDAPLLGVGNFGFSLHRPAVMLKILCDRQRWYGGAELRRDLSRILRAGEVDRLIRVLRGAGKAGTLRGASKIYEEHCDIFWGQLVSKLVRNFRVAPPEVALRFSWEVAPSRCYTLCSGNLPFGLHAWARYDFGFLKPLLERNGVELDIALMCARAQS